MSQKTQSDALVAFVLLRRLLTSIVDSDAYKAGLINSSGKVKKLPSNEIEREYLTVLDQVVFKLKRLLGTKLTVLNKLLYLVQKADNSLNRLNGPRYNDDELERLKKDLNSLGESQLETVISICDEIVKEGQKMGKMGNRVKFKQSYQYRNYDFDYMNKAMFEMLRANNSQYDNKYLKMSDAELEGDGFFDKYPHLRKP